MLNKNNTEIERPDLQKVMAVFSQRKNMPPFPAGIREERVEIPYINKTGTVVSRPALLLLPESDGSPVPLVYMSHYALIKESVEVIDYLNQGWAVASPTDFSNLYNAQLSDDDLVFNNAALYTLSRRPEIDRQRIAVTGGSAGGYMTLMLSALQLGICCSAARSALTNLYFTLKQYGPYINSFNESALREIPEEDRLNYQVFVSRLPLPFANVLNLFSHEEPDETVEETLRRYTALSPVGLANAFSAPLVEMHFTSDLLVPVDQVTRRYTCDRPGASLPSDYRMRLSDFPLPGVLGKALDEVLPADSTELRLLPLPEEGCEDSIYYAEDKPFTIAIYDEGAPENYASHSKGAINLSDISFIRYWFTRGRRNADFLNAAKAELLVERYAGQSLTLPAREGIDDTVYGSLAVYRSEIVDALREYQADHPEEGVQRLLRAAVQNRPELSSAAECLSALLSE